MKKNIDSIRLENMFVLIGVSGGPLSEIAKQTGIGRPTLSAIQNGKPMLASHARIFEKTFSKSQGWMDVEHNESTPPLDKDIMYAVMKCIHSAIEINHLYDSLSLEGKVDFLDHLYSLFSDPAARELSTKTLLNIVGVKYEESKGEEIKK